MNMFALISGEALLNAIVYLVIWAVILWVLWWGLGKIAPGEPFAKIGTVILVILTCVVLINLLLGLLGHPIVDWGTRSLVH